MGAPFLEARSPFDEVTTLMILYMILEFSFSISLLSLSLSLLPDLIYFAFSLSVKESRVWSSELPVSLLHVLAF